MPRKELEAEVQCPTCKHLYGSIFRVLAGKEHWSHETIPASIPKYCSICEIPLERKH